VIRFTDTACQRVLAFMDEEGEEGLSVRIDLRKSSPFAPEYDLALVGPEEISEEDRSFDQGGFRVYADAEAAEFLDGAEIDWVETLQGSGFQIANPNVRPLGSEPPSGPLAERVERVLREQINPGVASHGGLVSLVDIRDNVVFLRMGGGCQGCGMASVTLTQGIKEALRRAVPEIEGVEDVTDHAAGRNPYYA
jgi:Fe/S biogenesis protein NfuA